MKKETTFLGGGKKKIPKYIIELHCKILRGESHTDLRENKTV